MEIKGKNQFNMDNKQQNTRDMLKLIKDYNLHHHACCVFN